MKSGSLRVATCTAVLLLAAALGLWCSAPPPASGVALTFGGRSMKRRVAGVPLYKQWDPAWGRDELGVSGERMRNIGCLVCCVAMVYSHYGVGADPGRLNAWLSANEGYTSTGLLKWDPCVAYARGAVRLDYNGPANQYRIDYELERGNPVIVKVRMPSGVSHWVLVVGKDGLEYLVHDPLGNERGAVLLSRFGRGLYSMRVFRRTARP
ncbi:MAG: C39 family peptidase [Planctomycetota bacterium]